MAQSDAAAERSAHVTRNTVTPVESNALAIVIRGNTARLRVAVERDVLVAYLKAMWLNPNVPDSIGESIKGILTRVEGHREMVVWPEDREAIERIVSAI
jgi:hypothetical protein